MSEEKQVEKVETTQQQNEPFKTFTSEDDLNNFVKKQAQSHASKKQKELLDRLGIKDVNDHLEKQKQFKEWQESQMSETEKLNQQLQEYKTLYEQQQLEMKNKTIETKILKANVDEKYIDFVKFQLNSVEDIDVGLQQFLESNPQYIKQTNNVIKNTGTPVKGVESTKTDGIDAYFKSKDPYWDKRSGKLK